MPQVEQARPLRKRQGTLRGIATRVFARTPSQTYSEVTLDQREREAAVLAKRGLDADVVMAFPYVGSVEEDAAHGPRRAKLPQREAVISAMATVGLRVVRSTTKDRKTVLLKITAPLHRLEEEAERLGMDMLLRDECKPALAVSTKLGHADRPHYADFTKARREDFALKNGRLFSSLERQRLLFSILEATHARGGAQLNLDQLVSRGVLSACLPLHAPGERAPLYKSWRKIRIWPWRSPDNPEKRRRIIPDLGLNQQPLHRIRDYYGEKIAFYFGWLDKYTSWLWLLMWAMLALELLSVLDGCPLFGSLRFGDEPDMCEDGTEQETVDLNICSSKAAITLPVTCVVIALWAAFRQKIWRRKQNTLAYEWDVLDFEMDEAPRAEFVQAFYSGIWRASGRLHAMRLERGFYTKGDGPVRHFVRHPDGQEVMVMSSWQRLKAHGMAVPTLLIIICLTLTVMISIFSFRMLMRLSTQYEGNTYFNRSYGPLVGAALNTIWISIMNVVYQRIAVVINNLENHRTETEHEDALILKTFLFQFVNSYGPLFYLAFLKPYSLPLFDSWGLRDPYGKPYVDTCGIEGVDWWAAVNCAVAPGSGAGCGASASQYDCLGRRHLFVREDCWGDLRVQMICFTLLKPMYELPIQILLPRFLRWWRMRRRARSIQRHFKAAMAPGGMSVAEDAEDDAWHQAVTGDDSDEEAPAPVGGTTHSSQAGSATDRFVALASFADSIEHQIALAPFRGTFYEYNAKVVQFGYLALFSATLPLAAFIAAAVNFFELRVDATKIGFESRRPNYQGARDVGSWQTMMALLTWGAILVNVLLLFTSWSFRDYLVVPWFVASATGAGCASTFEPAQMTPLGRWAGTNTSWYDRDCADNYRVCFKEVGAAPWLPASVYLDELAYMSRPFYDVLCEEGGPHFSQELCSLCGEHRLKVFYAMVLALVVLEHLVILAKLLICLIPDKPRSVAQAEAADIFVAQLARQQRHDTARSAPPLRPGAEATLAHAAKVLETGAAADAEAKSARSFEAGNPSNGSRPRAANGAPAAISLADASMITTQVI